MTESKVRLNLYVPGAKMLSSQECDKNPKRNYNNESLFVEFTKKGTKLSKERISYQTRKPQIVTQTIVLTKDSYDYMLENTTTAKLSRIWKTIPIKDRLAKHFNLIAEDMHAIYFTFEILED